MMPDTPGRGASGRTRPRGPRGLGAQDRRIAVPGQRGLNDLSERREDGVEQLGHDEADQSGALAPQPARTVVAEHVEGDEDGLAGGLGDARLAVEDAADGRLADLGMAGDVSQPRPAWSGVHLSSFPRADRECQMRRTEVHHGAEITAK